MFCDKCGTALADRSAFCRSCGAAVATRAVAVPSALPLPTKRRTVKPRKVIGAAVAVLFLMWVIISLHDSPHPSSPAVNGSGPSASETAPEQSQHLDSKSVEVIKHKIGDSFSVGYWTYVCNGARWQQIVGSVYSPEYADASFLVVDLTIQNNDKTSSTLPPIKLIDAQGREYDESSKGIFMEHSFGMMKDLNPGVSSRGLVVFDVPRRGD